MSKDDPKSSDQRLNETLDGVSASELKAAKKFFQEEKGRLLPSSAPPSSIGDRSSLSSLSELKEASRVASNFMSGMDKITDVLMILVGRFGRASNLIRLMLVLLMCGALAFSVSVAMQWSIMAKQEALQLQQQTILRQLKALSK